LQADAQTRLRVTGRAGEIERAGAAVEQRFASATASCSCGLSSLAANFCSDDLLATQVAIAPISFTGWPPAGCGRFT
jgi:hypothetical protein